MRAGRAAISLSAVFLDRDGVINRKAPAGRYVTSAAQFSFLPGTLDALARLATGNAAIVVVTNQRGVARGMMTAEDLDEIHHRMGDAVERAGGRLDAIRSCPHEVGCRCRKPETGMFQDAAAALGLDLSRSAMIGDSASDMEAARRIGALGLRIAGAEDLAVPGEDHRFPDLAAAVAFLFDASRVSRR